ncbi:dienelactone hydrolase family protein [Faucicola atlantae]|uniref:dienelactone hydrolase family protein n=1 Tax=Faucicola atlantae TaxID=34059 RepID=UPI0025B079B2|nr:dienelactone hydrolase family protein [Moraxella atlantae]
MDIQILQLETTSPDGTELKSYVCLPKDASADKPAPAILVAPEWWGVVEFVQKVTERLARAGFAAVAMDVYGEGKLTTDANQANEWMEQMLANQDQLMARCQAILKDFCDVQGVDSKRLGGIGFCFGGKIVLDMAREGLPLQAVATFHGNLTPKQPAEKGKFAAKVLVAQGEADTMTTMDDVEKFKAEMDNADVDYTVDVYEGAKHSFSNPAADERAAKNNIDLGYDEAAANASWDAMIAFMQDNLANAQ